MTATPTQSAVFAIKIPESVGSKSPMSTLCYTVLVGKFLPFGWRGSSEPTATAPLLWISSEHCSESKNLLRARGCLHLRNVLGEKGRRNTISHRNREPMGCNTLALSNLRTYTPICMVLFFGYYYYFVFLLFKLLFFFVCLSMFPIFLCLFVLNNLIYEMNLGQK